MEKEKVENEDKEERIQMNLHEASQYNQEVQNRIQADSPFVKIQNHETVKLPFPTPPKIYKRIASGTDPRTGRSFTSEQIEFELRTKNPDGIPKTWSIGAKNNIVPEILAMLSAGISDIPVHREGEGIETKYSINKERKI